MSASFDFTDATADHLSQIMPLVRAVGWSHRSEDVGYAIDLGYGLVAVEGDGSIIGVGLAWNFGTDAARVGLIIVSPDCQGRGIGRRLVEDLIARIGERSIILLATDEGKPLYEKLGFRTVGRAQRHAADWQASKVEDSRLRAASVDDHDEILALDHAALGTGREEILCHLLEVGDTVILEEGGRVTGYAVDRAFARGRVVGPIIAASEDDALVLFRAVAKSGPVRIDRPAHAERFGAWLAENGLTGHEVSDVMIKGSGPDPKGPHQMFAMASHAWG